MGSFSPLIPPYLLKKCKKLLTVTVDRTVIQEDQTEGQVIRAYTIDVKLIDSTANDDWLVVAQGTSIGNED